MKWAVTVVADVVDGAKVVLVVEAAKCDDGGVGVCDGEWRLFVR